jgi:hypothetical protein
VQNLVGENQGFPWVVCETSTLVCVRFGLVCETSTLVCISSLPDSAAVAGRRVKGEVPDIGGVRNLGSGDDDGFGLLNGQLAGMEMIAVDLLVPGLHLQQLEEERALPPSELKSI